MSGSNSLLKALRSEKERRSVPSCIVCSWLACQDGDVVVEIDEWVERGLEVKALWRLLGENGMPGSDTTFRNHLQRCGA